MRSSTILPSAVQLIDLKVQVNRMNQHAGSALHEAAQALLTCACPRTAARLAETAELLLERGADPFLENASGVTAADMLQGNGANPRGLLSAMLDCCTETRRAALLRRMEACGQFSGPARVQVAPFSSRDWSLAWLAVVPHRYSSPFGATPRRASPELICYASAAKPKPLFRLQLDSCCLERIDGAVVGQRSCCATAALWNE